MYILLSKGEYFDRKISVMSDEVSGCAWSLCDSPYGGGRHPARESQVKMFAVRGSQEQENGPARGNIGFTARSENIVMRPFLLSILDTFCVLPIRLQDSSQADIEGTDATVHDRVRR